MTAEDRRHLRDQLDRQEGVRLKPYTDTVGKWTIGIGRNLAGVHWRSDFEESIKLGEKVAIAILRDQKACYRETFSGFTFTRFDGAVITV